MSDPAAPGPGVAGGGRPAGPLAALRRRFGPGRLLGRGSFGAVYEVPGDPPRALKVLTGDLDRARIAREMAAARAVSHPNVLPVYDAGFEGDAAYLLMPRADRDYPDWAEGRGRAAVGAALRGVAEGLAALHAAGLIHRDLKPENVLMIGDTPKIADLGLTKGGALGTLTATGYVLGTPRYMAPEAVRGEKLTPAADVYALGVMLYTAWRGGLPHRGKGVAELLTELAAGGPGAEAGRLGDCPALVRACLDPDPAARPAAAAVAEALRDPDAALATDGFEARGPAGPAAAGPGAGGAAETLVRERPGAGAAAGVAPSASSTRPLPSPARSPDRPEGNSARMLLAGVGWALVLTAGGAWFAGAPGPREPARGGPVGSPEGSRDPGTAAGGPAAVGSPRIRWPAALGAAFATRAKAELRAARTPQRVEQDGVTDGAISGDPADLAEMYRALPALRAWEAWLRAGGGPETLPDPARAALKALDLRYESEGLIAPFRPWLEVRPSDPRPVEFAGLAPARRWLPQARSLRGWAAQFATMIKRLRARVREMDGSADRYFRARRGGFPAAAFGLVDGERAGVIIEDTRRFSVHSGRLLGGAATRLATRPWFADAGVAYAAAAHLAARAIRADPADADAVVGWFDAAAAFGRAGRYGGYALLDPATLLGPLDSPELRVLAATLTLHRRQVLELYGRDGPAVRAAEYAAWAAATEGPGADRLFGRQFTPWVAGQYLRRCPHRGSYAAWRAWLDSRPRWVAALASDGRYLVALDSARLFLAETGGRPEEARRVSQELTAAAAGWDGGNRAEVESLALKLAVRASGG